MMKNLDCNQIMIVINLEIIGEENKKKKLYLFLFKKIKFFFFFLQFGEVTWCKHGF